MGKCYNEFANSKRRVLDRNANIKLEKQKSKELNQGMQSHARKHSGWLMDNVEGKAKEKERVNKEDKKEESRSGETRMEGERKGLR